MENEETCHVDRDKSEALIACRTSLVSSLVLSMLVCMWHSFVAFGSDFSRSSFANGVFLLFHICFSLSSQSLFLSLTARAYECTTN